MKKKLTEIYGLREGPFDDINKQLGSAQSVARDPRSSGRPQQKSNDPSVDKAQGDLNKSKSIFDEALGGDVEVMLSNEECEALMAAAETATGSNPGALGSAALKIHKAMKGGSSSSSMSSTKSYGSVKLQ